MSEVTFICQPPPVKFTLAEANALLPLLKRISDKHDAAINRYLKTQRYFMKTGASQQRVTECDNDVVHELQVWGGKVLKLGVKMFQGGYFGFDCGYGYFSWYPTEPTVVYYHGYLDKPSGRRIIAVLPVKK